MPRVTPCLWFDDQGEEAAAFYVSIFPNSRVGEILRYTEAGPGTPGTAVTVSFELDGQPFTALNGGPQFTFSEAVSFEISCRSQEEVDYYWTALSEQGEEGPCGWLKDKYGVSWQVVPARLLELLTESDPDTSARVTSAMLGMKKLDVRALELAAQPG